MADIPIEKRRKRGSVWPWFLGLLVVVFLIWLLADDDMANQSNEAYVERNDMEPGQSARDSLTATGNGSIEEFVQYVEQRNGEISKSRAYLSQGLAYLADALDDLYDRLGPDIEKSATSKKLRNHAQQLEENADSPKYTNIIKNALLTAANALQNLQVNYFPKLEGKIENVVETARKLQGKETATGNEQEIDEFFEQAAITVDQMSDEIE